FPKELMDILNADYGIIGEGERLILLLKALEDNRDISDIPGIITRETNAAIPDPWNNEFTRIFNPENRYIQLYLQKGGMLNLQTKRGCPFECIYCTYPHIEGKHLRLICPDDVANTAKMLQEAGAKYLFITDSAFNSSYSHSIDVARAFINAGISIPWGAFFAPTKPPHDFYRIMADAGLTHVEFGTESMCNDILKSYKKPFNLNELFTAHRSASDAGLHIAHYLLLGGPDESDRTINETLENADKLDKSVFFFFCGIRIYPHTELYDIAIKERQISDTDRLIEPIFYNSQNLTSDEIIKRVEKHADGRPNWVIGAGGEKTAKILERMYTRGRYGPLWEHLIP
ncbi:MAG: radical SAM protein, partial [Spirochaetota bacterium]|nr:radical SAM protein [Spirochaetota bacterium]